ncbi:2-dehydro-3-deoxyphosphooctonate aldolase [Trichinella pseudospiralis]
MTLPYLRSRLRRPLLLCAEHSAPSTKALSSPPSFSGLSPPVVYPGTSRGLAVVQVHPMPGRVACASPQCNDPPGGVCQLVRLHSVVAPSRTLDLFFVSSFSRFTSSRTTRRPRFSSPQDFTHSLTA